MTGVTMMLEISVRLSVQMPPHGRSTKMGWGEDRDVAAAQKEDLEALCRHVLEVAQKQARRQGLRGEEAEDCALEFLERMLLRGDWSSLRPPHAAGTGDNRSVAEKYPEAWLRRCADNFARNVRRRGQRVARREAPWPEWNNAEGDSFGWEGPDAGETPETLLLRRDLVRRVHAAVGRLTPSQQDLFERHFLREETVAEAAEALGRTPHAVSQALLTLRKRLKGLLERQGLDEETARQYLGITEPYHEFLPFPVYRG